MYSKMITSISNFSPELEIRTANSYLIYTLSNVSSVNKMFPATLNPYKQSTSSADIRAAKP